MKPTVTLFLLTIATLCAAPPPVNVSKAGMDRSAWRAFRRE